VSSLKVTDDSAAAKGLALSKVAIAEVVEPDLSKGIEVFFRNGENVLVNDPINDVGARWVCQRALIVVEFAFFQLLLRLFLT
jgi:hypothetical protein